MGHVYSVSQIFADQCEQDWAYRYLRGLKPIRVRPEMDVGSFTHICIAAYFNNNHPSRTLKKELGDRQERLVGLGLPQEQLDELEEDMEGNANIAWDVYERWGDWFGPADWEPMYVEHKLEIDLGGGDTFWGIVDFVGASPDGMVECIDWKVRGEIQDPDRHRYPLQQVVYAFMLYTRGIEVDKIGTCQMRGVMAKDPKINKNGAISRSAVRTTWDHYAEFAENNGQDPDEYLDMKEKLEAVQWHRRDGDCWGPNRLEMVWDSVVLPRVRRLQSRYDKFTASPIRTAWGTAQCSRCFYADLCSAELFGEDFDIDEVFEVKLPRSQDGKV